MISTLAIIGGGATGVGALMAAIQHEVAGSIYVIDPRPIGGVVFGTTDDEIICNTSVDITTLDPDNEDDFLEYLKSRQLNVSKTSYTTRRIVGEYIKDRFDEYSEKAKLIGIDVKYLNFVCRKVLINNYKYQLVLSDRFRQEELNAESVIICTGHGAPKVP
ncbi:FAD/NAD(P)-binding protein [Chelativorans sp. M5D2P16]|uniref:FAD/NAD(P)-binding protein n=1 Tax=Chelativorans sp. M5D2P16 TaxID=3095678 RepID=UPI002ACA496B|nr:FAD/NAD(P)-binding protein [Chelativorans sp. M5D2P16]MDZ5696359.1 FAD/NAD(P)-binding protein [Chelativorans sp. M5D2P16]